MVPFAKPANGTPARSRVSWSPRAMPPDGSLRALPCNSPSFPQLGPVYTMLALHEKRSPVSFRGAVGAVRERPLPAPPGTLAPPHLWQAFASQLV